MLCGEPTWVESAVDTTTLCGRIYNDDIISAMHGMLGMH